MEDGAGQDEQGEKGEDEVSLAARGEAHLHTTCFERLDSNLEPVQLVLNQFETGLKPN